MAICCEPRRRSSTCSSPRTRICAEQNLAGRRVAILVLPEPRWSVLQAPLVEVSRAVNAMRQANTASWGGEAAARSQRGAAITADYADNADGLEELQASRSDCRTPSAHANGQTGGAEPLGQRGYLSQLSAGAQGNHARSNDRVAQRIGGVPGAPMAEPGLLVANDGAALIIGSARTPGSRFEEGRVAESG